MKGKLIVYDLLNARLHLPPNIILKMEKRDMLNRPSVQHVAANIRLKPNGHTVVFEFT